MSIPPDWKSLQHWPESSTVSLSRIHLMLMAIALTGCAPTVPPPEPAPEPESTVEPLSVPQPELVPAPEPLPESEPVRRPQPKPKPNLMPEPEPASPAAVSVLKSSGGDTITIHVPFGAEVDESILNSALGEAVRKLDYSALLKRTEDDSIIRETREHFSNMERLPFRPVGLTGEEASFSLTFALDRERIVAYAENLISPTVTVSPTLVTPVTPDEKVHDSFDYLPDGLLLEPCPGVAYPKSSILLPNAPRAHRSGTHRGIDFQSPYGAPIRAAEGGVIIRADHGYEEITNDFRKSLLKKAAHIGRTPSDVFEHILFGQAVYIDHGIDIVKGKRLVTIYAHMSEIAEDVTVGATVKRGQTIGKVGASGTSDGALGNWEHAHLHFELIIQDKGGERYMGQGLRYNSLTKLLERLFVSK